MPDTHIKVGGSWKAIDNASVKVSGAWKQVNSIYIKVAGAWEEVWNNITVTLSGTSGSPNTASNSDPVASGSSTAIWEFRGDNATLEGTVFRTNGSDTLVQFQDGVEWVAEQDSVSDTYWIKFTDLTGSSGIEGGSAKGTWLALTNGSDTGSTRNITLTKNAPGAGTVARTYQVDISTTNNDSGIIATGHYELQATLT